MRVGINVRKRRKLNPVQLWSVAEIAERYRFHPNTVRAWVHRDGLRYYRKGRGGKILIREDDLLDFLVRAYETDFDERVSVE